MKDKVESTDNIEDFDEDIPFPENWKRYDLDTLKQHISDWFDWNIQHEYTKDPEFYLSNSVNEKRFYFRVIESGGCDDEPVKKKEKTIPQMVSDFISIHNN